MLGHRCRATNDVLEVTPTMLKKGYHRDADNKDRHIFPVCTAGARDLEVEAEKAANPEQQLDIIFREHECKQFIERKSGRSPQEHEQMAAQEMTFQLQQRVADLQSDYVQWKKEQATNQENLTKTIEALRETRHQEARKDRATFAKWQIWTMLFTSVIAAAAAIIAAIAAST